MKTAAIVTTKLGAPAPRYVQAIPLYMGADEQVSKYFQVHRAEIDAITGSILVIAMPIEVAAGNVSAIAALFGPGVKNSRYPGLLRSDLPCLWLEDGAGGHEIIRLPDAIDEANAYIRALTDAIDQGGQSTASGIKAWALDRLNVNIADRSTLIRTLLGELPVTKSSERLIALIFGVIFVAAILALAVVDPNPTPFQYQVFRIVLAIAAAGFVSMTPGFLQITISNWVRAGGALAVFVIIYFYNPASLAVSAPPAHTSSAPASKGDNPKA